MIRLRKSFRQILLWSAIAGIGTQIFAGVSNENEVLAKTTNKESEGRQDSYEAYLERYDLSLDAGESIEIQVNEFTRSDKNVHIIPEFEGAEQVVRTEEEGYVEWVVDIPEDAWYQIEVEYYPVEGRSSQIERQIAINGQVPFFDANHLLFSRVWSNATAIQEDNRGNEMRPRQVENPTWQTTYLRDSMGYYIEPYQFFFEEGKNTITLSAVREPMVIKSIRLHPVEDIQTYEEVMATYEDMGYTESSGEMIKIQGEDAQYKSDPTLYPLADRASPVTEPYHSSKLRMNMIGDTQWKLPGQWIEWEIEVEEAGLYEIVLKQRQDMLRGSFSTRQLLIDGKVPFEEAQSIPFKFNKEWELTALGDDEPYLFYLDEGTHHIRLEVTLGELGNVLNIVENSIYELNKAYRSILMLTGPQPDLYRDYEIDKRLPDVITTMEEQSEILLEVMEQLIAYTGKKGSEVATIEKLALQMEGLVDKPYTIPERLEQFKNNVASLGTWVLTMREQPLAIDYIAVKSPDVVLEPVEASLWDKMMHEIRTFIASFFEDYTTIGNAFDEGESLEIWVMTGRDQAQIIKGMIEDEFTPQTGIGANVKLVDPSVLLPSTVAGNGPDVAMQIQMSEPVNYAIRNAVVDISQFEGYDQVEARFHESAMTPYRFNDGVYALPETQEFPMLFYRTDILDELGLEVPNTWEDLINLLPTIQKNHMNFAIPVAVKSSAVSVTSVASASGLTAYAMFLYQLGGELYSEDGMRSIIDEPEGVEAFEMWTEFFVNYKLPLEYDFANRFRTGEIPIGITNYSMYNRLAVFAPEIRGLWEFAPIPGIMQEDGTIDRSVPGTGVGMVMMESSENKEAAWEYMKWWTSTDMQVRFGREMESVMGASARYPTANQEALAMLPWTVDHYNSLMEQWDWVKGNPEVPGSYFTPRHLDNAFRKVVYDKEDPRETILDYTRIINEEIQKKRKEFGMPTLQEGEK